MVQTQNSILQIFNLTLFIKEIRTDSLIGIRVQQQLLESANFYSDQHQNIILQIMKSAGYRQTLRASFVNFPHFEKPQYPPDSPQDIIDPTLLARYYDESYQINSLMQSRQPFLDSFTEIIIRRVDYFPIFMPEATWLLWWNFMVVFAILFNLFEIPIAMFLTERVYKSQFQTATGIVINAILIIILFVDTIVIRPNIGIYRLGKIVTSHRFILKKYLFFEFQFNLVSCLVLLAYAISNNYSFIYAKVIFYLYFLTLYRIDSQICAKIELLRLRYAFYKLLRVIFFMFLIVLWISCIYFAMDYSYYLARNEYYPTNLWLTNSVCSQYQGGHDFINLVQMYDWYVWLTYAFYWTFQSISMVGYGDMTPRNPPEVAYCDFVVLIMTLMYAFFINSVWQIIAQASELQSIQQTNRKHLMKYRKKYEIQGSMLNKLGSYMYQMWKHGKTEQIEEQINISLSEDLRNQLLLAKQKKFFYAIGIFDQLIVLSQEHTELFREWSYLIREKKFGENEKLFQTDDIPQCMYSLIVGQSKLSYLNSNVEFKQYENTTFGLHRFFIEQKYGYQCVSLNYNKVACLNRTDFLSTLKLYPTFYVDLRILQEKYQELVEDMKIYKDYTKTGEQCWICSSDQHQVIKCPQLFSFEKEIRDNFIISLRRKRGQYDSKQHKEEKWLKAIRRYAPRKIMQSGKMISNKPIFPQICVDRVTYLKNYRIQGNI